jgi:hypothetical protein
MTLLTRAGRRRRQWYNPTYEPTYVGGTNTANTKARKLRHCLGHNTYSTVQTMEESET